MHKLKHFTSISFIFSLLLTTPVLGFDSGSTGDDGALAPTEDVTIPIPADGILNYTSINIPEGVTVRFGRNQANTPAILLVQASARIDGTIDISGRDGRSVDPLPPGGFEGGLAQAVNVLGGNGRGPGGGSGGCNASWGGTGGSYFSLGDGKCRGAASSYGNNLLQPLIGGSGGGAGMVNTNAENRAFGTAGGSGGGAILIAVSGSLILNGQILANGGVGEPFTEEFDSSSVSSGGGGSGGAVRIVASFMDGTGIIDVSGGTGGEAAGQNPSQRSGGDGGYGRVSIEVETMVTRPTVLPTDFVQRLPQPLFLDNLPTIRISSIEGFEVPQIPSGDGDVILPDSSDGRNVTIEFEATGVPESTTVKLIYSGENVEIREVTSDGLTLDGEVLTDSVDINLREGNTVLIASLAFSVSSLQANRLSRFTNGETVKKAEVASSVNGENMLKLITESGNEYIVNPEAD